MKNTLVSHKRRERRYTLCWKHARADSESIVCCSWPLWTDSNLDSDFIPYQMKPPVNQKDVWHDEAVTPSLVCLSIGMVRNVLSEISFKAETTMLPWPSGCLNKSTALKLPQCLEPTASMCHWTTTSRGNFVQSTTVMSTSAAMTCSSVINGPGINGHWLHDFNMHVLFRKGI